MNILKDKPWETLGAMRCDPVTIALVASTAISAVGAISSGNAAKSQADYQAKVAENNAITVGQQTAANVEAQDRDRRLRRGANFASAGASGVGIDSFGDILQQNAALEQLDILTIQSEGLLQQQNFESEASLAKARGKSARTAGYIGAASSILGGASKLGGGAAPAGPSSEALLKAPTGSPSGFSIRRV